VDNVDLLVTDAPGEEADIVPPACGPGTAAQGEGIDAGDAGVGGVALEEAPGAATHDRPLPEALQLRGQVGDVPHLTAAPQVRVEQQYRKRRRRHSAGSSFSTRMAGMCSM
jgi:hypothetical protein